ncbi:Release factor glutamine methyltransferase [biofilm metagenome]
MKAVQTIHSALKDAAQLLQQRSDSPQLDAEILLAKILEKDRAYLRTWPEHEIKPELLTTFNHLVSLRQQGQPIAYLTGVREFWSREFIVTPDVLIPRPETELLVELSLTLIPKDKPYKLIDLGTGSGIIAITLANERKNAKVTAIDSSEAALQIAKTNATLHNAERIEFYHSHWFNKIPTGKFDMVISNPPYVAASDPHLDEGDLCFEPLTALISGRDGLSDIKTIAESVHQYLNYGGHLLFEHGYNQQVEVQNLLYSLNFCNITTHVDLAGKPRVTMGQYLPPK